MNFLTNFSGTGSDTLFQLKTLLVAAGWTVTRSSDGTTYNSSGDQISSGSSGTGGLANSSAWFCIKMPAVGSIDREWCFQRGTSNTVWRIKYSTATGGFNSGSPSATRVGTASAEAVMWGGGTDASPTFAAFFGTDSTYWAQAGCQSSGSYGFWLVTYAQSGRALQAAIMVDPVTANTGDTDPYVYYVLGNTAPFGITTTAGGVNTDMNNTTSPPFKAWYFKGTGSEAFASINAWTYSTAAATTSYAHAFPAGLNLNGWTGVDDRVPVLYGRTAAQGTPVGFKGVSTFLSYYGPSRNTADTYDSLTRIVLGKVSLPWNGSTTPQ